MTGPAALIGRRDQPWPASTTYPIAARAPRRGTGLSISGTRNIIMGIFDIFSLRPTEQTAAGISDALARAVAADAQQAATLQQALDQRDALLLDGSASALKAAEATLAAAREPAERVATIKHQLEQRLKEATERETMAAAVESRPGRRRRSASCPRRVVARAARASGGRVRRRDQAIGRRRQCDLEVAERHAHRCRAVSGHDVRDHPAVHPNDPGNWQYDVGSALSSDDPAGIARIGNPQQPGAF